MAALAQVIVGRSLRKLAPAGKVYTVLLALLPRSCSRASFLHLFTKAVRLPLPKSLTGRTLPIFHTSGAAFL